MDFVLFLRNYINTCDDTLVQPICCILLDPVIHSKSFKVIKNTLLNPHLYSKLLIDQYTYIIAVFELSKLPPPQLQRQTDLKNDYY